MLLPACTLCPLRPACVSSFCLVVGASSTEVITAIATIALLSIQMTLTLATLGLIAGYDGAFVTNEGQSWIASSFDWLVEHCLSFFFVCAFLSTRYECNAPFIKRRILWTVWFLALCVTIICWLVTVAIHKEPVPYESTGNVLILAVSVTGSIVPCILAGLVSC